MAENEVKHEDEATQGWSSSLLLFDRVKGSHMRLLTIIGENLDFTNSFLKFGAHGSVLERRYRRAISA